MFRQGLRLSSVLRVGIVFYLAALVLDWVSTIVLMTDDRAGEANELARLANGKFDPSMAWRIDVITALIFVLACYLLYKGFKSQFVAALPLYYEGYNRLTSAVLHNLHIFAYLKHTPNV